MTKSTRTALYQAQGAETTEEIIGVLTAISVVSKRMAKKLALLEERSARKDGGKHDERTRRFPLMPIRAKPYQHQRDAFAFVHRMFGMDGGEILSQGAALLMEMGTGKTITSIAITGALYLVGNIRRVLVVAPLSIVGVCDEEFAKFAGFDYVLAVLSGTGTKKADTLRHMRGSAPQVAVVNYESAWRLEKEILAWKPDLVIADEGHKIKTHNIAASRAMHKIGAKAGYRLLLTGTVITNKALDVFSQYKFLNPAIFGASFYVFRNRYFDMVGYGNHTLVMKRPMERDLMKRLHSIAFRATKAECLDLPPTHEPAEKVIQKAKKILQTNGKHDIIRA